MNPRNKGDHGGIWTVETANRAVALYHDGRSASEIARSLGGFTRNAVIGKLHRLGVVRKAGGPRPPQDFTGRIPHRSSAEVARLTSGDHKRPGPKPKPKPPTFAKPFSPPPLSPASRAAMRTDPTPLRCETPAPGVISLLDLDSHMCKWPIGDPAREGFGFCGRPSGGVYCDKHHRIAYQPQAPKRIAEPYEGRKVTPAHLGRRAGGLSE